MKNRTVYAWAIVDEKGIMNNITEWKQCEIYLTRKAAKKAVGSVLVEIIRVKIIEVKGKKK